MYLTQQIIEDPQRFSEKPVFKEHILCAIYSVRCDVIRAVLQEERLCSIREERRDIGMESQLASLITHPESYLNPVMKTVLRE